MAKETSDKAAKSASKVLRDDRTGKDSKTSAGSALSQKESEGKKRQQKGEVANDTQGQEGARCPRHPP